MLRKYYPINLDVTGKKVVVVGGGVVAERKVISLVKFGAEVLVIAPRLAAVLAKIKGVGLLRREYRRADIKHAVLVVAATDNMALNRQIARDAMRENILVNVVDAPDLCSFIVPSMIKRGPLVVSISTSGQAPAMAKALRLELQKIITPQLGKLAARLGKIRRKR